MNRFEGRVAIVTGGASGVGDAIVRSLLLAEGASVAAIDINSNLLAVRQREFGNRFYGMTVT